MNGASVQSNPSLDFLNSINLFRNLYDNYSVNHAFTYYLISTDIDVNAFLNSPYQANKNILLLITNNRNGAGLNYNDMITENMMDTASMALTYLGGNLYLQGGNINFNDVFFSYQISLGGRALTEYSKVFVSILFDTDNAVARLIVLADNILIPQTFSANYQPLFFDSQIFSHPALGEIIWGLVNPRLDVDYWTNGVDHAEAQYPTEVCSAADAHCNICAFSPFTEKAYCLSCRNGWSRFNEICWGNSFFQQKLDKKISTK